MPMYVFLLLVICYRYGHKNYFGHQLLTANINDSYFCAPKKFFFFFSWSCFFLSLSLSLFLTLFFACTQQQQLLQLVWVLLVYVCWYVSSCFLRFCTTEKHLGYGHVFFVYFLSFSLSFFLSLSLSFLLSTRWRINRSLAGLLLSFTTWITSFSLRSLPSDLWTLTPFIRSLSLSLSLFIAYGNAMIASGISVNSPQWPMTSSCLFSCFTNTGTKVNDSHQIHLNYLNQSSNE